MRLYQKGIRFRVPFPEVTHQNGVLTAAAPYPGAVIRYTADGNEPTCFSPLYTGEIKTEQPENYRFKTFFTPHWGSIAVGIEKLPEEQRKVVYFHMEGKNNFEIAEIMQISVNTVKTHKV